MKNIIKLKNLIIKNNKIEYIYDVEGNISKYFFKNRPYFIEYSENIESVPVGILTIPFVTNILPIIWIFNGTLEIDELDKEFYNSISKFKDGYKKMYPMIEFKGNINIGKIVENEVYRSQNTGCFFSGGLDAYSTLISNIDSKPLLINLQGSDIELKYTKVLENMKENIIKSAEDFNLDTTFIKSSFRTILKEKTLNKYIKPISGDNYWHGFQHGIAIIGHAAPIAYTHKLDTIFIAASFTNGDNVTCASDPTIDNFVKLSSTKIKHDGYEFSRIDKSDNIGKYLVTHNKKINLRVCLDDYRADNCCNCEKCFRTIYGFIATGYNPSIVGFNIDENIHKKINNAFKYRIILSHTRHWDKIKERICNDPILSKDSNLKWIQNYDFSNCNNHLIKYFVKIYYALKKRILYLIRIITKVGR